MRKTDRSRKNNLSMQLDQTKENTTLYIFPNAQKFKKNTLKPKINQQVRQQLQKRIQLQGKSRSRSKRRQYSNNFYMKYTYNPFIDVKNQLRLLKPKAKRQQNQFINLADLVGSKSTKKTQNQRSMLKQIKNFQAVKQNYEVRSYKLQQQHSKIELLPKQVSKQQIKQKNKLKDLNNIEIDTHLQNLQIEQIAELKQNSFFINRKINIFQLARDEIQQVNSNDYLDKYKFSRDSLVQKKFVFKLPIFRDLSQMGRNCLNSKSYLSKNIVDYIFTQEQRINPKQILFNDVMSMASNRMSPQYLIKRQEEDNMYGFRPLDDNSSQQQIQSSTIYKKKQVNRLDNYVNFNQEYQQIKEYLKAGNIRSQEQNQTRYQQQSEQILKAIQNQRRLTQLDINDKDVHFKLSEQMKQQIKKFIGVGKPVKTEEFSQLIDKRKSNVNRKSVIKLKALNNLLDQKNKLQQFQQQSSRNRLHKKFRRHSQI